MTFGGMPMMTTLYGSMQWKKWTQKKLWSQSASKKTVPIYKGASLSVAESAVLILTFALRHSLNGECLSDLLTLISLHCATVNLLHTSLHRFRSFFIQLKTPLVFHSYCSTCEFLVKKSETQCPVCKKDLKEASSYFVEIPILTQLQEFFNRSTFHSKLQHRRSRPNRPDTIGDIYDGELYRKHCAPGEFLDDKNNISLMWYTDGVPLFKSSKVSIWPLFLAINELPYSERFVQENLIFTGLWFGKSKPSMACFLKPFHDTLNTFFRSGFTVHCNHCSNYLNVRGLLMCGTCDLPAKCMVLNMNQFNGQYGCASCMQPGTVLSVGKGHARTFPFIGENIAGPTRSHGDFINHGEEAFVSNKPVFGVKGPSWLVNICPDIIKGNAIDYMHCVLLGVVRRLLVLWFDPKFSAMPFSMSSVVSVVDSNLARIRPPYFIKRHPSNIKEHSSHWKASDCRAWLFYYSIPVLFGVMKAEFFHHYLLFVEAIYIFNLDNISSQQLEHGEDMIIKFCGMYASLYGDQHMSANIHQLLHLGDTVRQLGPLWVYSCFSFESVNGQLVKLFHGTQNPVIQIANAISSMLKIPALSEKLVVGSPAYNFYTKLTGVNHHFRITEIIFNGAYVIGSIKLTILDVIHLNVVSQCVGFAVGKCYLFQRLLFNRTLFHCNMYHTHARNSCTVVFNHDGERKCGKVLFYLKVYPICHCIGSECRCSVKFVSLIQVMTIDDVCSFVGQDIIKAQLNHVLTGRMSPDFIAINIEGIIGLGVCVELTPGNMCVTLPPNNVEGD